MRPYNFIVFDAIIGLKGFADALSVKQCGLLGLDFAFLDGFDVGVFREWDCVSDGLDVAPSGEFLQIGIGDDSVLKVAEWHHKRGGLPVMGEDLADSF